MNAVIVISSFMPFTLASAILGAIIYLSRRVIGGALGFLSDYFVVMLYGLVVWGFVASDQSLDTYMKSLVDTSALAFTVPGAVLIGYLLTTYFIYLLWYRRVVTYSRWMYAVRVLLLLLLPLTMLVMVSKLAFYGQLEVIVSDAGEGVWLAVAVLAMTYLSWAFASLMYAVSEHFSEGVPTLKPVILPGQMINILFRKQA